MIGDNEFMARYEDNGNATVFITTLMQLDCNHIRRHHRKAGLRAMRSEQVMMTKLQLGNSQKICRFIMMDLQTSLMVTIIQLN